MAAPNPLSALPSSGTFPVNLAPSLLEAFDPSGKKRKRSDEELIGFRYAFKPASITPSTPGSLNIDPSGSRQLAFETPSGGEQVFDAKEETGRSRECVLLWDETTSSFTLHAVPTTLLLTLNRSLSSTTSRKVPTKAASVASSTSSASVPLAMKRGGASPVVEEAAPKKRSRPSEVVPPPAPAAAPIAPPGRAMKGGKSLPRKTLPAHAPLPPVEPVRKAKAPAKGRGGTQARGGKAAGTTAAGKRGGKAAAAAAAAPKGKFKSAEIIEDSDDEDGEADADGGGNEMADEFARMVGESLAAAPSTEAEGEDEEEYEEEDDDEGELGGARLVVNDSGGGYDDHSEWL